MIEQVARAHWWHRNRQRFDNEYLHVLEGHTSPLIEHAWLEAKDTETKAMRTALQSVSLVDLL